MDENKFPKVNAELFKGQAPEELTPQTYYAYIDSIEKINGITHLRFDCIIKKMADDIQINKETIIGFPSIVLDVSGPNESMNELFGIKGRYSIYNYESKWVVINTSLKKNNITASEFFNFIQVGEQGVESNYSIEGLQKENDLDDESATKIKQITEATTISESPKEDVQEFLNSIRLEALSHVNVYNIGQGNCNAVVDSHNFPLLYFDVGGGSGANKSSYPANFKLCHTNNPQVILSHWDLDHIVTAVYDPLLLKTKWLVPIQSSLSNTAIQIANALQLNGNLICWNATLGNLVAFGNHYIAKCNAPPTNKNSSGLSLYLNYKNKDYVLLPGDATFRYLPPLNFKHELIGLVASHHGAKSSIGNMPSSSPPAMLAYSFGIANTHKHAHSQARTAYRKNGWGIGLETQKGSIAMAMGLTNLNTPCAGNVNNCSLSIIQQF